MRALVIAGMLVLLGVPALAQNWDPQRGWDGMADFEQRRREVLAEHERRVAEMDREFEESRARSEEESKRFMGIIVLVGGVVIVGSLVAGLSGTRRRRRLDIGPPLADDIPVVSMAAFAAAGTVDVAVLRIGIDGRASKFVRTELEAIAKTYAGNDAETRARRLREVSVMLRRVRDSWVYGGADNEPLRDRDEALGVFARHVDEARTRIGRKHGPDVTPPSGIPVSMILVSIVVAARGELMTVTHHATGEDLRRALEAATHRPADDILALEVVWVPDKDGEHVSSIDLESVYRKSELHPLDGVTVGKVFCTYCNGPFPAELVSCPHCGGPAPGRERRA